MPKNRCFEPFYPPSVGKIIFCDVLLPLLSPLFTWYVGAPTESWRARVATPDGFTASLSGENAARAVSRVPPRVRAHARLHAFSSSDKDLIDFQITVMARTGLTALGQ